MCFVTMIGLCIIVSEVGVYSLLYNGVDVCCVFCIVECGLILESGSVCVHC